MKLSKRNKKPLLLSDFLAHPVEVFLLSLLVKVLIFSLFRSREKAEVSEHSLASFENQTQKLTDEVTESRQELEFAQSDLSKEKVRRNELLQKKDGEIVVQIPEVNDLPIEEVATHSASPLEEWQELLFPELPF